MKMKTLIMKLQSGLNTFGAGLRVDGEWGPKTEAALSEFEISLTFNKRFEAPLPGPISPLTPIGGQDYDEGTTPWYRRAWAQCEIREGYEQKTHAAMRLVLAGTERYTEVAKRIGARNTFNFARILGVIHFKEASCDFMGVLHNGQKIVGTQKKTTIVPIGRGPFSTWENSAVDAIVTDRKRWDPLLQGSTDIGAILRAIERFNGLGYISGKGKADTSPYLWGCSTINDGTGRYTRDGVYDPKAQNDSSPGAALLLKQFARSGLFEVAQVVV